MANYWIGDLGKRVLGPVPLEVVRDLLNSGQLRDVANVSRDGRTWGTPEEFPEIQSLLAARGTGVAAHLAQQATHVREYLKRVRQQPLHETLRIDRAASLDHYRAAFFGLVKRFYPDRLPPEAPRELRSVCEDAFLFLAGQMVQVERTHPQNLQPRPQKPPVLTATTSVSAPASPAKPAKGPTYAMSEFIGLERRGEDRVEARIQVNAANVGIFTNHPLTNISMGGIFIPTFQTVPLETIVDLVLTFPSGGKEIKVRGRVVWENAGNAPGRPVGVGVRFSNLAVPDRDFIQGFVANASRT